jgi:hypothetical protein
MRTATVHELKKELAAIPPSELLEVCLRLAKYKKDNKELMTFLLFEAHDLPGYMEGVKAEVREQIKELSSSPYLMKKGLRKILRITNKYIRYAGSKEVEVELLLYFCAQVRETGLPLHKSTQLSNLFDQQRKKIQKAVSALHEDLQYDYLRSLKALDNFD